MITTDEALLEECRNGTLGNFTKIYERYFSKIYSFVFYKTCNRENSEDITSQVFMKALEKADTFDSSRGSVASWLFKIASNTITDHFRKHKTDISIDDLYELTGRDNVEKEAMDKDTLAQVMKYFNALPEKKRDIVLLRVWQDMPYHEIAVITGMSEASCKMSFYRTIEELRSRVPVAVAVMLMIQIAAAVALCGMEVRI
jgi:RNA polymerase sigma-70 factor (ECF subfamily)